ncbi:hypothetical protein PG995_012250 [Apiospora arundinis]
MTIPQSQTDREPVDEFHFTPPPGDAQLPTACELLQRCPEGTQRACITWPLDKPIFWVKYSRAVHWNEVMAQHMARQELRRLDSPVRAPTVHYAFKSGAMTFIIMEYISGTTAMEILGKDATPAQKDATPAQKDATPAQKDATPAQKDAALDLAAQCVSELHRIPVPAGSRPAAVDGGYIRHPVFDEEEVEAGRHYENTAQLEDHVERFLKLVRSTTSTLNITDLSLEPLVFCQPDWYAKNFMVDDRGQAVAIDFADASFVPSSFVTYLLSQHYNRLGEDVDGKVWIPPPEGTRNATALRYLSGRTMARSYDFYKTGEKVSGGDRETQDRIQRSLEETRSRFEARYGVRRIRTCANIR